jgi:Skp family chaperone for outer membrane proteins
MNKKLTEDLNRFKSLMGYDPTKGVELNEAKTRKTYLAEADPEEGEEAGAEEETNDEFDFGGEGEDAGTEEGGEEGNTDFDFGDEGSPEDEGGEEMEDEFGTASEFSAADDLEAADDEEVEEIDVTAIVQGSDEAKEMAQQAVTVGQENSSYLKSLTDKLSNLESQLSKMDTIASKIGKLEQDIKTPEEKLELRSLDSYPFNMKLSDYWEDKASKDDRYRISSGEEMEDGKQKEFVLNPEEIQNDFSEDDIKKSFNP